MLSNHGKQLKLVCLLLIKNLNLNYSPFQKQKNGAAIELRAFFPILPGTIVGSLYINLCMSCLHKHIGGFGELLIETIVAILCNVYNLCFVG